MRWNILIPGAAAYKKPQDEVSLDFQKKYRGSALIYGEQEDIKHMLAGLDSYLHPVTLPFARDLCPEEQLRRQASANYDLATWLGDAASALAESYKQHISLPEAFKRYANYQDIKANIAAFNICRLCVALRTFPIGEILQTHYQNWHNLEARRALLRLYFSSLGLSPEKQGQTWQFTEASRQKFHDAYIGKLKLAAYAYYFSNYSKNASRIFFKTKDCITILDLLLTEWIDCYNQLQSKSKRLSSEELAERWLKEREQKLEKWLRSRR